MADGKKPDLKIITGKINQLNPIKSLAKRFNSEELDILPKYIKSLKSYLKPEKLAHDIH